MTLFENSMRIGGPGKVMQLMKVNSGSGRTIADILLKVSGCSAESRVTAENLFL